MWALCFIPLHLTSFFAAVINTNATPGRRLTRALNMRRNKLLSVDLYGRLSDEDEITLLFLTHKTTFIYEYISELNKNIKFRETDITN